MSDKSPLFVSALELLAHATELYREGRPRKYKFVVLHLANAVELLAKDMMIDRGLSIFDKPNHTVNLWDAFASLEEVGITFPERPVIELLVSDRNNIQHRFGFPDGESTFYYLEQVVVFFGRLLDEAYHLNLAEVLTAYLSTEDLELLGLAEHKFGSLNKLRELSNEAAIVQAFNVVEGKLLALFIPSEEELSSRARVNYWRRGEFPGFLQDLEAKGFLPSNSFERFLEFRRARNEAAHVAVIETPTFSWEAVFSTAWEFIDGLTKAEASGYTFSRNHEDNSVAE